MSGVNFVSMGHTAEVLAWRITVKDGVATLYGGEAGAYVDQGSDTPDEWTCVYTADELRDLAALFSGAADLLDGEQKLAELWSGELDALPIGAKVLDCDDDPWTKISDDQWRLKDSGIVESAGWVRQYGPFTLVSSKDGAQP